VQILVRWLRQVAIGFALVLGLTSCAVPQIRAEQRIFLNLNLDFLGEYRLPAQDFQGTQIGGLSGISYDRLRDRFYALSDDPGIYGPPRFYTLRLELATEPNADSPQINLAAVVPESVTVLRSPIGDPIAPDTIYPKSIALSPQSSVYIASGGNASLGIGPELTEFSLETGTQIRELPVPDRYQPRKTQTQPPDLEAADELTNNRSTNNRSQGIQPNGGFAALTLSPTVGAGATLIEPFRLFTATERPLWQDQNRTGVSNEATPASSDRFSPPDLIASGGGRNRLLHYLIQDGPPILIAEHLYLLSQGPQWSMMTGLSELMTLDQGGHFLSLERSTGLKGASACLFQVAIGGATDISGISSLPETPNGIAPVRKQLLLDLADLGLHLEDLEGMTLGPQLPDGSRSLLLVSDNNFKEGVDTQFLLFRLKIPFQG